MTPTKLLMWAITSLKFRIIIMVPTLTNIILVYILKALCITSVRDNKGRMISEDPIDEELNIRYGWMSMRTVGSIFWETRPAKYWTSMKNRIYRDPNSLWFEHSVEDFETRPIVFEKGHLGVPRCILWLAIAWSHIICMVFIAQSREDTDFLLVVSRLLWFLELVRSKF